MIDRFVHNYAVTPEAALEEQIRTVSNSKAYHDCDIAIMADSHVRATEHKYSEVFPYEKLKCLDSLKNLDRVKKSLGTLGGGR